MLVQAIKQGVKHVLIPLKHIINRHPAVKRPIMVMLRNFPELEYRLKRMGRMQQETSSRYIPTLTPNAKRVFEYLSAYRKEDRQ